MVFKGTSRRSAEQIAQEMDSVGGMLDAFTVEGVSLLQRGVLHEHLPLAFDVISDLTLRPRFAEEDIVKERQVILEEIRMEEDNPETVAHELLTKNFWRGHSLGAPILGTRTPLAASSARLCWTVSILVRAEKSADHCRGPHRNFAAPRTRRQRVRRLKAGRRAPHSA